MKYYFFVNPAAGKGKGIDSLIKSIDQELRGRRADYRIVLTDAVDDGRRRAMEFAAGLAPGEQGRFYACGGDGTLNEIINGVCGFSNAAVGMFPTGTGNDTVRNFTGAGDFMDVAAQLDGGEQLIDLMEYSGIINGQARSLYAVNMFNIGFDCNVVELAGRLKRKPGISGPGAYYLAILGMFIEKKGIDLRVTDLSSGRAEVLREGRMLLCSVSNGSYCGGGVYSSPQARMDDGLFDVNMISDVSRMRFLRLLPKYQNGTYLNDPLAKDIVFTRPCSSIRLEPYEADDFFLCADGEIALTRGITIRAKKAALRFIVPARRT